MICFPNAKINLGLNIINRRPDGYHSIETIFYPVPITDALEIIPSEKDSFSQIGIPLDTTDENNLVIKALHKLREHHPVPPLEIHLLKAIPFGAGLGGGSADAAFMLKLVNSFCKLNISDEELGKIATTIGADCPFFIRNTPVFATGIGTIFSPVELSLKGYHFCLVKPDISVSTPKAYSMVTPKTPSVRLTEIIKYPIEKWKEFMVNDFEMSVFKQFPEIRNIKDFLYAAGAIYAAMSGSGSSVFGIFKEKTSLSEKFPDYYVWEGIL